MKYIYVAGPYTFPDLIANVRAAIDAAETLWAHGFVPYVPHLSMMMDLVHPQPYDLWCVRNMYWLARCDALLRLKGKSLEADTQVERAKTLGQPVFLSIGDLLNARDV